MVYVAAVLTVESVRVRISALALFKEWSKFRLKVFLNI